MQTMTPELREEVTVLLREEIARAEREKAENRTAYQRVCKAFEQDFEAMNYVRTFVVHAPHGTYNEQISRRMDYKVRNAIGTLLRAIYQVDTAAKLPAEKEPEISEFVGSVLALMKDRKNAAVLR